MDLSAVQIPAWIDLELIIRGCVQVLLLTMSAFFSGSETALFSLTSFDLQRLRNSQHPRSKSIHEMLEEPRRLIISLLCGNELVNIASSANMAAIFLKYFTDDQTTWINILVMVPLLLLFGEVTPKTIAVTYPMMIATNITAALLPKWIALITPLRNAVRAVADRITSAIVGEPVKKDNLLHSDEFRTLVEEGEASGVIVPTERILIDNMLEASEAQVVDIMTPISSMVSLDVQQPLPDLVAAFQAIHHARVPLFEDSPAMIVGFLHSEDVIKLVRSGADLAAMSVRDVMRQPHFVPSTKKVDEMVEFFQENRTRTALVIGEYANVLGIVSIRDVAAFMLGRLAPPQEPGVREIEVHKIYSIPGDMSLVDFNQLVGANLDDPSMNTVGGVVMRLLNRLPRLGDSVTFEGFLLAVERMQGLRIEELRVTRLGMGPDPEPTDSEDSVPSRALTDETNAASAGSPDEAVAATVQHTHSVFSSQLPGLAGQETPRADQVSATKKEV
ncbi:CBS domain containing protein [Candidatus Accumulibacter aalborgensis]|uniref:CBS domain containing protein n=1 Tax=Candidatus Accumulibacter aalborgensis TaxID=1860102 RepID=A0A1A8XCW7_9PROT|nr:hemolysin family protein [Candidatus Accumulibacter aalborgensis]SBT03055.1 CBS domain containing protein [Candidatus Accumulibacter aalborgensis]